MACKEEKLASTREANSKGEASLTADQQKKLHEKVDKCKQDSQKVRASAAVALTSLWDHHYPKVFSTIKPKANQLTAILRCRAVFSRPSVMKAL